MSKNKLNKKDLSKILSYKTGLSLNLSSKIIDDFILIIINNLTAGNLILKNIGTFKILKKNERIGRNPKTKEKFIISARNSISFTPSKKITKNLNKIYG